MLNYIPADLFALPLLQYLVWTEYQRRIRRPPSMKKKR